MIQQTDIAPNIGVPETPLIKVVHNEELKAQGPKEDLNDLVNDINSSADTDNDDKVTVESVRKDWDIDYRLFFKGVAVITFISLILGVISFYAYNSRTITYSIKVEEPFSQTVPVNLSQKSVVEEVEYATIENNKSINNLGQEGGFLSKLLNIKSTYISSRCDYEFQYPSSWIIENELYEQGVETTLISESKINKQNKDDVLKAQIACIPIEDNLSTSEVTKLLLSRYEEEGISVSSQESSKIKNGTAFYYDLSIDSQNNFREYYIFRKPGQVIIVNVSPFIKGSDGEDMFEEMIKSFNVGD